MCLTKKCMAVRGVLAGDESIQKSENNIRHVLAVLRNYVKILVRRVTGSMGNFAPRFESATGNHSGSIMQKSASGGKRLTHP